MTPARVAVCVGINRYGGGADLAGCVNDARDWAGVLGAFSYATSTLLDHDATKANILQAISSAFRAAGPRGKVVITYSGHGTWIPDQDGDEPDQRDEAICPVDYRKALITDDDLFGVFQGRPTGSRVILISDSCHAGTVHRVLANPQGGPMPAGTPRFLPPASFLEPVQIARAERTKAQRSPRSTSRVTVPVLAACSPLEVAYDANFNGRPAGAFTRNAINVLVDEMPRTLSEWMRKVRLTLPSLAYPQTPQLDAKLFQRYWKPFA